MFNTIHHREGTTAPSNTGSANSHNCIYRFGIDTLRLTYRGVINSNFERSFEHLKEMAQDKDREHLAQVSIVGHVFRVLPSGGKNFAFAMSDNSFFIQFSRSTSESMPMAVVQISSEYLQSVSTLTAYDEIQRVMANFATLTIEPTVSRCDIFCDLQTDYAFEQDDTGFVTITARNIISPAIGGFHHYYEAPKHGFSGFQLGRRKNLFYRFYDKTLEIHQSDKLYMIDLWKESGWDGNGVIWRSEFQVETPVLKSLGLNTVRDILNSIDAFWSYLTKKWLRLCHPVHDRSHSSRDFVLLDFWSAIQFANGYKVNPCKRNYTTAKLPQIDKVIRLGLAGLSSYMAANKINDLEDGIFKFFDAAKKQQYNRGSIYEYLGYHVARKNRIYSTVFNTEYIPVCESSSQDYIPF